MSVTKTTKDKAEETETTAEVPEAYNRRRQAEQIRWFLVPQ